MASWRMVLTAFLGMAMLFACANEGNAGGTPEGERGSGISMEDYPGELGTFEGLDAETEWQILLDFCESRHMNPERYIISGYFGTYNGYIVVDVSINEDPDTLWHPGITIHPIKIADWYIDQFFHHFTTAWKNGKVYSLGELYHHGELTLDDLRRIADLHPGWRPLNQ